MPPVPPPVTQTVRRCATRQAARARARPRSPNETSGADMNAAVLRAIVSEVAPRVVGSRIVGLASCARDCIVLTTDTRPPVRVGIAVTKALPLLYIVSDDASPPLKPAESGGILHDLVGSTIVSFEAAPEGPRAILRTRWTDQVGRPFDRSLAIDLGGRPSLQLRETEPGVASQATGGAADSRNPVQAPPSARPAVAWRRDESGRLHVGMPPNEGAWEGRSCFDTWGDAAAYAARELLPEIVTGARRAVLSRVIARSLKRKRRALEKVSGEIADSARAGEYRHKAQLLLMRKNDIRKGATPIRVLDYDNVTEVEIDVDPALSAARNAEHLFARARKAERRAQRAPERRAELEADIEGMESDLRNVGGAAEEALSELESRHNPPPRRETRRRGEERARFRTYTISGGWKVLVGKSNKDNDILTHRIARPSDLWFHVRQSPGSHVILQRAGRTAEPGPEAIMEAAAIAAFHSKSSGGSNVPVCYAERRYVRKPRGAKPGLAVVSNERVVFVDPGLPD